jgi:hypothetical protein
LRNTTQTRWYRARRSSARSRREGDARRPSLRGAARASRDECLGPNAPRPLEADFGPRAIPLITKFASLLGSADLVLHATDPDSISRSTGSRRAITTSDRSALGAAQRGTRVSGRALDRASDDPRSMGPGSARSSGTGRSSRGCCCGAASTHRPRGCPQPSIAHSPTRRWARRALGTAAD